MKKLIASDKHLRESSRTINKQHFILKSLFKNDNFSFLIRSKAFLKLKKLGAQYSAISLVPRCVITVNKKRHNKLTLFSRQLFLKSVRAGHIHGFKKASW
jgi:ribosomal protein S14